MKNKLIFILFIFSALSRAQTGLFINGAEASLRVDSTSFLSVEGDFQNLLCDPTRQVRFNGTLYLAGNLINNDILKFTATTGPGNSKNARIIFTSSSAYTGGSNAIIGGSVSPNFWEVELDKGVAGSITLSANINCSDTINFKTGSIYMNGYKFNLVDPIGASIVNHPYLKNERHGCQFMPVSINDTGLVTYNTIYSVPMNLDPANIGVVITGSVNMGSKFKIKRGFMPQVNAGKSSILRYFDIRSPGHALGINTIKVKYVLNDAAFFPVGYFNLTALKLFVSGGSDINWSPLPSTFQNTLVTTSVVDGMLSAQLADLSLTNISVSDTLFRITIADSDCPNLPVSSFLQDTLHICTGNTFTLDAGNNSPVSNSSLRWEWNTIPFNYTQTQTVSPNTGYQKFLVKLMDARGCESKDSIIIAPQAPYPQITYFNHLNSCIGDSITIKDTVEISSGSYSNAWFFSDATTSTTIQNLFKKKFSNTGEHSMQLITTSNYGCSVTATSTNIIVYPLPTVGFTNSLNCLNGLMSFTNTSVSNHTALILSSLVWNLGQGSLNTSTLAFPSQTYSASGNYTVKLTATSSFGCKDSISNIITIYPTNQALFVKNNSCLNDTVFFNNTTICNTGNCSYNWSFGDASQTNSTSPKKVYGNPGLYNVKLKVTNPFGCPDSVSTNVFVNPTPNTQFASTNTHVCINTYAYFTNNSNISSGSITSYSWSFGNSTSTTSANSAVSYSNPGIYSVSLNSTSDSGCVSTFVLPLMAQAQPTAHYTVSNVCLGTPSQFVTNCIGSGLNYVWDYGNTVVTNSTTISNHAYLFPNNGNYNTQLIIFDSWGCSDTASVATSVFSSPVAAFGGSVSTCGTNYTLDAGNSGSVYLWQPGNQITQTVQVTSNGIYSVTITNTNNCVGSETVLVTLNSIVKPKLGNDTIVCGNFNLNAGYPGSSYLWNTGSLSQTISASTSSLYSVQVIDPNGCIGWDSINIVVNSPATVNLGNDLVICKPKYGYIINPTSNATLFLWSTGLSSQTISVLNTGSYWLEVTTANGCKKRDTVLISFLTTPQINLGTDRSVCGSVLLDAQNIGASYLWSNGDTNRIININSTNNYWVTLTNTLTNCTQQDSIYVTVNPMVNVFLGNDTTLCNNLKFLLNANNPGSSYTWTSGQTNQTIPITSSGVYGVTVTSTGGCFASDFISITLVGAPVINLGNAIQYLCGNTAVELELNTNGQINWGSTTDLSTTTKTVSLSKAGKYWVTVQEFGCSASDTVLVVTTNNTIQALFLASTLDTVNKPVKFVNLSDPMPTSQFWSFGDGVTSKDLNPVHTYVLPEDFSVTLEVSNGFCTDKITKQLSVLFKQTSSQNYQPVHKLELLAFNFWPNPSNQHLNINFELNDFAPIELEIYDITGRLITKEFVFSRMQYSPRIDVSEFNNGLYFLNIIAHSLKGEIIRTVKFIKTN